MRSRYEKVTTQKITSTWSHKEKHEESAATVPEFRLLLQYFFSLIQWAKIIITCTETTGHSTAVQQVNYTQLAPIDIMKGTTP